METAQLGGEYKRFAVIALVCLAGIGISMDAYWHFYQMVAMYHSPIPWLVLAIGLLITGGVTAFFYLMWRESVQIRRLVGERTHELQQQTRAISKANEELLQEIHDRQKVEAALRESEHRYRMLAENVTDVIYTFDFDLDMTFVSPSVFNQRGWTVTEALSQSIEESMTSASGDRVRDARKENLSWIETSDESRQRQHVRLELEVFCKDGSTIITENRVSFLYDDLERPIGFLAVSRDITHRKRIQEEKAALETQVRHAQKMDAIGRLAGGVAHDFNNLLTCIVGCVDLIKRESGSGSPEYQSMDVIEKAALRGKDLTTQLLSLARKREFERVPVDVNKSIREVVALLTRTIDKKIDVKVLFKVPVLMTLGDPGQIHQLLLNLAVNARDAMPEGGELSFETSLEDLDDLFCRTKTDTEPGRYVVITVSDDGLGMHRDKLERIFEPFFTDKPEGLGTGMGLSTVYGGSRSHGGAVTVESAEGVGSSFSVYLPYLEEAAFEESEIDTIGLPQGSGHILIVDDEEMVRVVLEKMLTQLGYTITTMEDGIQACDWFARHSTEVDIVIVDMTMPLLSGWECMQRLRTVNPLVPVLMSTGHSRDVFADLISENDRVGIIQKPFQMQKLAEAVASMFQGCLKSP